MLLVLAMAAETFAQSNNRNQRRRGGEGSSTRSGDKSSAEELQDLEPLSSEAQAAMNQFELTRTTLMENKRQVDKLYRTIPIGFVEKQKEHMRVLKLLEAENEILEQRIVGEAVDLFRLAPGRNRFSTILVMQQVQQALDPTGPEGHFNPKLALEICSLMLSEEKLPWEILIRAFRASYALQDFERARMILDRLEEIGTLKPVYYEHLEETNQKWQDELLTRRLESQTADLPIATFKTTEGTFRVELFENQAPLTVNNFVALAEDGYYDGRAFFQVIPSEYAATGCPNDNGTGTVGYTIPGEATREKARSHFAGTLTMMPNALGNTGAKFLISHQPKIDLDGRFTAFGRVMNEQGLQVVYQLTTYDATKFQAAKANPSRIISVTIENKRSHDYVKSPVGSPVTTVSTPDDGNDENDEDSPSSFDLLQRNN
jgi:cyclophilin family peptidyl-prolyl cis-trans isomerase